MKIIGITINDVLSDFSGKFIDLYNQTYPNKTITSVDIYNLGKYFDSEEDAIEFVYSEAMFELFGCSNEIQKEIMSQLKTIESILKEDDIKLVILSEEYDKVRCAILYFLSKTFCKLDNIQFVDNILTAYNYFDYVITTDYKLFYDNKTIKIETEYNKDKECKLTLKNITQLPSLIEQL